MLNPSRGCQREGSLGGRKKATAEAGWHFPGAFAHPQDTSTCQEAFAWLGKSLVYCCPFQLNFLPLSILDKSLYVTAALWIMLKQTCQPAKEKHVVDLRLQCSVHAQLNRRIGSPLRTQLLKLGNSPLSEEKFKAWAALEAGWSAMRWLGLVGACSFFRKVSSLFSQFENRNTYFKFMKAQKTSTHWYEMQQALFIQQHTILSVSKQRSRKVQITLK